MTNTFSAMADAVSSWVFSPASSSAEVPMAGTSHLKRKD